MKRLKKKIEHLREQPEATRLRALIYTSLGGGGLLLILWLVVLLPFQIRVQGPADENDPGFLQALLPGENKNGQNPLANENQAIPPTRQPQVGGTQHVQPTRIPGLFKTATPAPKSPFLTATPTPTDIPNEASEANEARLSPEEPATLPVEEASPTPSPSPTIVPNEASEANSSL